MKRGNKVEKVSVGEQETIVVEYYQWRQCRPTVHHVMGSPRKVDNKSKGGGVMPWPSALETAAKRREHGNLANAVVPKWLPSQMCMFWVAPS